MLNNRTVISLLLTYIALILGCAPIISPPAPEPREQQGRAERREVEEHTEVLESEVEELYPEEAASPDMVEGLLGLESSQDYERDQVRLTKIIVNGSQFPVNEESGWFKKTSKIEILGDDGETKIVARIKPGKGLIEVNHSEFFPVEVLIEDKGYDSLRINLAKKMRKYKVAFWTEDLVGRESLVIKTKVRGNLELGIIDLLGIPFAWKVLMSMIGVEIEVKIVKGHS